MENIFAEKLEELLVKGEEIALSGFGVGLDAWKGQVQTFLYNACGKDIASEFGSFQERSGISKQLGYLGGLAVKVRLGIDLSENIRETITAASVATSKQKTPRIASEQKVFIVHGHNNEAKETVARFIQKINLTPLVLHEQANKGLTIIEKFEAFSDVEFAVILLTPDDIGYPVGAQDKQQKRARQNVVLELGYFLGKLGRERVCALYTDDVEIPSDYQGVLYVRLDKDGAWKTKLAQEIVQVGINIKLEGLL
jgi:predicted nucleotide-binding protein